MYEFSSTEEVITFCFADFSIRSNTKDLVLEKLDGFESDLFLLSHLVDTPKCLWGGGGGGGGRPIGHT